ncbi:MAG: hypothetical protein AAF514_19795, partial [Verrucomicrobiota bacterium]
DFSRDLARRVAADDEREILLKAVEEVDSEERLQDVATAICRQWGKVEPAEAAQWVESVSFEEEASRWRAGGELIEEWMEVDRNEALIWFGKTFPEAAARWMKEQALKGAR